MSKKTIYTLVWAGMALLAVAATVKISEYPAVTTPADTDKFLLASGSTNKNITYANLKTSVGIPASNTVATLPATGSPGQAVWCSDVITSWDTGDLVRWDGSKWKTTEGVRVTASPEQFVINGWASGLNAVTPRSTVIFNGDIYNGSLGALSQYGGSSVSALGGASGAGTLQSSTLGSIGYWTLGTGTAGGTVSYGIKSARDAGSYHGTQCGHYFSALSEASNEYWAATGFSSTATTNYPVTGAFFLYDRGNANAHGQAAVGNWLAVVAKTSSYTYADTGLAASETTAARLGVVITATTASFYTNGVLAVTLSDGNVPTSNIWLFSSSMRFVRVSGTTDRNMYILNPAMHYRYPANRF